MANRGAVCWEIRLSGSERGWSATLIRMTYCGTAGKPGGKQRKHTSSYSQGSLQPTRTAQRTNARMKSFCGMILPSADPLRNWGRPMPRGKKRVHTP